MALDPTELIRPKLREDDVPSAPLMGTRAQTIQRLQVGLFGVFAMVLLVGLANIIMDNAQQNQATVVPEAASTMGAEPIAAPASDPLADAGVVPDLPAPVPIFMPPALNSDDGDVPAPMQP